jgi:succinate dehydrogenase / fumarate reductase flavoprotein subunit
LKQVIIVGTGISGLMSGIMLAQSGFSVILLSYYESIRSASCMAQGGINAAELRENDSVMKHFTETIIGGVWLADQQSVMDMCRFAPDIITMYDRIGVAFNRNGDGTPDTRYFGGSKYKRTHFADTTTGAQLLNALDGQVRYYEEQGLIKRISGRDFVSALIDENGQCAGCIVQNIYTMKLEVYTGVSLIVAAGGYAGLYGRSTNAVLSNGAVAGQLMMQGITIANPEFVQFHPTAMAQGDKPRLISESARGEGGRLWTVRDGKPWYFLEDMYPWEGNLVKRDLASRAIFKVVNEMKLGVDGKEQVYLDITHLPKDIMEQKLSNIIELYYKYCGDDARKVPMKVYPAPHYAMGGIFVNSRHSTDINGLYVCGECDYMYHGGNRLGGNSLLSATYSGIIAAKSIAEDWEDGTISQVENKDDASWIQKLVSDHEKETGDFLKRTGSESTGKIAEEMGCTLSDNAGIVRYNSSLKNAIDKIQELKERWEKIAPTDKGSWANSYIISIRKLRSCLILAQTILAGALGRDESRGAHFKPEFPNRDDANWLKKTLARYDKSTGEIILSYKPVDLSILSPGDGASIERMK